MSNSNQDHYLDRAVALGVFTAAYAREFRAWMAREAVHDARAVLLASNLVTPEQDRRILAALDESVPRADEDNDDRTPPPTPPIARRAPDRG